MLLKNGITRIINMPQGMVLFLIGYPDQEKAQKPFAPAL